MWFHWHRLNGIDVAKFRAGLEYLISQKIDWKH